MSWPPENPRGPEGQRAGAPEGNAPDDDIQRLLWAVGEARRRRVGGDLSAAVHGGRGDITVVGRFDEFSGPAFLRMVQSLVADGARSLVVDLGAAEVSVGGASVLAAALGQVHECKGELVLKSPRANTLKVLSHAGVIDRFPVC